MSRATHGILAFLALIAVAMPAPVQAADAAVMPDSKVAVPAAKRSARTTIVPPRTEYGCKRIWRCDAQVCEWRRGCWGVYGYMEAPYYSAALAQRQWVRDGWPSPSRER